MQTFIHSLVRKHALGPQLTEQLWGLAFSQDNGQLTARSLRLLGFLGVCAGLLLGLGVIFWVAANWQDFGKMSQFMLLQALLAGAVIGAVWLPKLRLALLLLTTLLLGGLLAFVGQTYQTGADPWQLFAAWAVLSLAWVVVARSDALWTFWVLLVAGGIALWSGNHLLVGTLNIKRQTLGIFTPSLWAVLVTWVVFVAQGATDESLAKLPKCGWMQLNANKPSYALRLAVLLALVAWSSTALTVIIYAIGDNQVPQGMALPIFLINTGLIVLLGLWLKSRARLDVAAFSLVVVAGNAIALTWLGRVLVISTHGFGSGVFMLFVFGGVAIALLGASGKWIMCLQAAQKTIAQEAV